MDAEPSVVVTDVTLGAVAVLHAETINVSNSVPGNNSLTERDLMDMLHVKVAAHRWR